MGDISDINSAQTVKIVGSNSSGLEQTPIKSTLNGELQTSDILQGPGVEAFLTVGTTAIEVKVGVNKLANRKLVTVHNNSNATIYWGYTNVVTTSTGTPIYKDGQDSWDISDNATIFLIAGSSNNNVRITESA
jgi:hypothetical protein